MFKTEKELNSYPEICSFDKLHLGPCYDGCSCESNPEEVSFYSEENFATYIKSIGGTAYLVGGAVRDEIPGRPVKDRDYVITGVDQSIRSFARDWRAKFISVAG